MIVHREPLEGRYMLARIPSPGEHVAPLAFPGDDFSVEAMFGRDRG